MSIQTDPQQAPATTQDAGAPQDETPRVRREKRKRHTAPGKSSINEKPKTDEEGKSGPDKQD